MSQILTAAGATVATASSADEALASLELFGPNVLVSDIGMPGRDGYDLIREVRARGYSENQLPAIALTALARPEDGNAHCSRAFSYTLPSPTTRPNFPWQSWVSPALRLRPWRIPNFLRLEPSIPTIMARGTAPPTAKAAIWAVYKE